MESDIIEQYVFTPEEQRQSHTPTASRKPDSQNGGGSKERKLKSFDDERRRKAHYGVRFRRGQIRYLYGNIRTPELTLELAMLRDGYVCSRTDCDTTVDLLIEYKIPLEEGGEMLPANAYFICGYHKRNG